MDLGEAQKSSQCTFSSADVENKQTTTILKIYILNKCIFYNHTITSLLGDLTETETFGMIIWKR